MSNKSNMNKKKADFLGIPFGTAMGRLRRALMFQLIQQCGRDVCFKCNEKIAHEEEMSIDHKKPWLYVRQELFWDLDNIAFSHRKCNRPDRPNYSFGKIEVPDGMSWCSGCQKPRLIKFFGKSNQKYTRNGRRPYCNDCRKKRGWK